MFSGLTAQPKFIGCTNLIIDSKSQDIFYIYVIYVQQSIDEFKSLSNKDFDLITPEKPLSKIDTFWASAIFANTPIDVIIQVGKVLICVTDKVQQMTVMYKKEDDLFSCDHCWFGNFNI